jgi:hypothetical protein
MRRGLLATLALALMVAACSEAPVPSPTGSAAAASALAEPSGAVASEAIASIPPDAAPSIDPAIAQGVIITCGDGPDFPAELLLDAGHAEMAADSSGLALREILNGPDGAGLPSTGWHRVIDTANSALFVAPDGLDWSMVLLTATANGWFMDLSGGCSLGPALLEGIGRASWWLDPAAGIPAADATSVSAFVLEEACASGKSAAGRVLPPVIVSSDTAISVMFGIRKRPGGQDCPGNSPLAIRIDLGAAIAGRALLDAGEFPPRNATVIPDH